MQRSRVEVIVSSRLHLSLFSMCLNGPRVNGGVGFAIQSPCLNVSASISDSMKVLDVRVHGLCKIAEEKLTIFLATVKREFKLDQAVSIIIVEGTSPAHHGFGTGTSIRLACLEALFLLNNQKISDAELVNISGRGGTSGIGIHTYFEGGLVVDLGRKNNGALHTPSSQACESFDAPLLLQQVSMPEWNIGICIPSHIKALTEDEEMIFFKKTCPIPESEAYKAMYYAVAGVYAAVRENDKSSFEASVRALQKCAWKKAERERHGASLFKLEKQLYEAGANAVGMSSLGPSLFFLADDLDAVIVKAQDAFPNCEFIKTKPANSGRLISYA